MNMKKTLRIALALVVVASTVIGTAAMPVAADNGGNDDGDDLLDNAGIDISTDQAEDGEAHANGQAQDDDESVNGEAQSNSDDGEAQANGQAQNDDTSVNADATADEEEFAVDVNIDDLL